MNNHIRIASPGFVLICHLSMYSRPCQLQLSSTNSPSCPGPCCRRAVHWPGHLQDLHGLLLQLPQLANQLLRSVFLIVSGLHLLAKITYIPAQWTQCHFQRLFILYRELRLLIFKDTVSQALKLLPRSPGLLEQFNWASYWFFCPASCCSSTPLAVVS